MQSEHIACIGRCSVISHHRPLEVADIALYWVKQKTERIKSFGLSKFQLFVNKRFKTASNPAVNYSIW